MKLLAIIFGCVLFLSWVADNEASGLFSVADIRVSSIVSAGEKTTIYVKLARPPLYSGIDEFIGVYVNGKLIHSHSPSEFSKSYGMTIQSYGKGGFETAPWVYPGGKVDITACVYVYSIPSTPKGDNCKSIVFESSSFRNSIPAFNGPAKLETVEPVNTVDKTLKIEHIIFQFPDEIAENFKAEKFAHDPNPGSWEENIHSLYIGPNDSILIPYGNKSCFEQELTEFDCSVIMIFDADGRFQKMINFGRVTDIAFDSEENLYVLQSTIRKFNTDGKLINSWRTSDLDLITGACWIDHRYKGSDIPYSGITVDSTGNIYLLDPCGQEIDVYDRDMNYRHSVSLVLKESSRETVDIPPSIGILPSLELMKTKVIPAKTFDISYNKLYTDSDDNIVANAKCNSREEINNRVLIKHYKQLPNGKQLFGKCPNTMLDPNGKIHEWFFNPLEYSSVSRSWFRNEVMDTKLANIDSKGRLYVLEDYTFGQKLLRFNHWPLVSKIYDAPSTSSALITDEFYFDEDNYDKPKTISIYNLGTANLEITKIDFPSWLQLSIPDENITIPPQEKLDIDVSFLPREKFKKTRGEIVVHSNDLINPDFVILKVYGEIESPLQPVEKTSEKNNEGGCLIATATYGSELAPQVQILRELRDEKVLGTASGTSFMAAFNQLYYSFSPTVADWERQNPAFKETVKLTITPLLSSLSLLQYVDIDSEEEMLGYGIGIILLNVGIYFVAPTVALVKMSKFFKK